MVLPTVDLIKSQLKVHDSDGDLEKEIKAKVVNYLSKCYSDQENPTNMSLLRKAAYLDPRFKNKYMDVEPVIIAELESG